MDKQPAVSVIVPVYKAENYLCHCVDSLLAQTFPDFEILLIDDGSPDHSGDICDEYARKDSRVRVFHKENEGVSSTRQCGIDNAKGEYTIHADPDDWVEPDMLEELYKKAKEEDADVVICDFYEDIGDKRKYIRQQPSALDHKTVLRELFQQLHGSCCNKLVKRACYNGDVRFVPDLTFCEDLCFNALILRKEIKIGYLPRAFYHYEQNVNAGSLTRNSSPKQYVVLMNILEKGLDTADFQMIRPILVYSWAYKAFLMRLYTDTQFRSLFWKYQLDFFRSILLSPLCFKKVILLFISCWSTQKWAYKIYELYKLHEIRK